MRLLLIEDSERMVRSLTRAFRASQYVVDSATDGEKGLKLALENEYDAIILDIMLPKRDGWSVLQQLREKNIGTDVLLLTARDSVEDRVRGLRSGADDYLVKPFALEELLARVEVLCRRRYGSSQARLRVGELEIDTADKTVHFGERELSLTAREYRILEYMAHRNGGAVTRAALEEHIYEEGRALMSNTVDSAICQIRKKMAQVSDLSYIRTRRGVGYILQAPSEAESPCPSSVG